MKHIFKKAVLYLLCVLSLGGAFFAGACNKQPEGEHAGGYTDEPMFPLTDIVLAEDGVTEYVLVVPAAADKNYAEWYAAEELAKYFFDATGARPAIETDEGKTLADNGRYISIGATVLREASGMTFGRQELNTDGLKIKRLNNTVIISGYNERGTLYGAYEFLKHQFGFVPYAHDETAIVRTRSGKVYLRDFDRVDVPSFESRDMDGLFQYHKEFAAMSRMSTRQVSYEWDNQTKFGGGLIDRWHGNPYDNLTEMLKPEIYQEAHPKWYSDCDAVPAANPKIRQFCLTFDERTDVTDPMSLLDTYVQNWQDQILRFKDTEAEYINFSEGDFGGYCKCSTCTTGANKYSQVGLSIRFANKVIARLEAWKATQPALAHKDFKYMIMAYNRTITAPVKVVNNAFVPLDPTVVPHPLLYIRWTPLNANHYYSYFDETHNSDYALSFKGWQAITDNFMIWDYDTNYTYYYPWFGNLGIMKETFATYYDVGVVEVMRESTTGGNLRSLGDLKAFLTAQIMWDHTADITKLTEAFMKNYYREAAPVMTQYINMMRAHVGTLAAKAEAEGKSLVHPNYAVYGDFHAAQYWPKQILEQAMELFDEAYAVYDTLEDRNLAAQLKLRVLKESVCTRFLILKNYQYYYNIVSPKYLEMVEQMERDVAAVGGGDVGQEWGVGGWLAGLKKAA